MSDQKESKRFVQLLQESYSKVRPYIAIILVGAICIAPLINNIATRVAITSALAVTLLFLIFDLFKMLTQRLDKIDAKLTEQEPPTYPNFTSALPTIKKALEERLIKNKDVKIKVLGVSAQFSWKNLVDLTLPELFEVGHKKPKISIEFVIVDPQVLHNWGQGLLEKESKNTLEHEKQFKKDYKSFFSLNRVDINIWLYDNIPHWHGVLIDNDIFFMGRCKWQIREGGHYHLQVGQKEYRQFTRTDRFRGLIRIELFEQWFDAYKFRSMKVYGKKENSLDNPQAT